MDTIADPYDLKMVVPNAPLGQLCDAFCHLANVIEDINMIFFPYDISLAMSPFAKLLRPFVCVLVNRCH